MFSVFIDGQAGTAGLQLKRRLEGHPHVKLLEIDERDRKDDIARARLMARADVVFLCLPDDEARKAVKLVPSPDKIVIDTSTAHRVNPDWAYGFSELSETHRAAIASKKLIANPGCHATGFISIAYPLVKLGLLPADYAFSCHSITGYSGGGKKMIAQYEDAGRDEFLSSPRQYALSQAHKHLPEMTAIPGLTQSPIFNPIVCDFYSGMAVSVPLNTRGLNLTADGIRRSLEDFYAGSELIEVEKAPDDGFIPANLLSGRDGMKIFVCGNDERITVTSVFDNLGKGAAGAAVQNMNIALGLDERLALRTGEENK
ncbi:MAG: N-acetyl-gamma-glutamyl-phosphate reductase [Clostridia bacterium]|nr:N-acetyl-gamma-glutamyl-phosphate reductase [Clostridia bacterium]